MRGWGETISEEVRLACMDQVNRSTRRSGFAAPLAAGLLVVIFGTSVPQSRMIAWAVTANIVTGLAVVCAALYLRRRRLGIPVHRWIVGPISAGCTGLAWASLPLFAFPSADHYELRAIYLVFLCGMSAANTVGSAARRSYFLPFQLGLLVPIDVVCLLADDRPTRILGLVIPVYFMVMIGLHLEVHSVVLSELRLRESNAHANQQLRTLNVELGEIALRDGLTGSANRVAFVDALSRAATEVRATDGVVGLLFLDLDRFKVVNDSLGHQAGDELLVEVADRIRGQLRDRDMLARLGGDEFTVLLRDVQDADEAMETARRIHGAFEDPFDVSGRQVLVTASVGVTTTSGADEGPQDLLRQADMAQYQAKENGRNRVELFVPALHPISRRRLDQEGALRDALLLGQVVGHFQPQVDLLSGRVVGAEALARWEHPERGLLSAAEFVPLAEQSDLILEVDAAVRQSAIRARLALAGQGWAPEFRVWCNVSAHQLTTVDPISDLMAELDRAGCDPAGIGIELTETAVMAHLEEAAHHIAQVRNCAVRVALDDFGTGHSSLALLRSMTVDELKVDRSFVSGMVDDPRDMAIVRAMTTLGKDLGLRVVAEGVETLAQATLLSDLRCDRAQGFLWSAAVPLDEFLILSRSTFATRTEPRVSLTA